MLPREKPDTQKFNKKTIQQIKDNQQFGHLAIQQ
jgi:hypothetical protein